MSRQPESRIILRVCIAEDPSCQNSRLDTEPRTKVMEVVRKVVPSDVECSFEQMTRGFSLLYSGCLQGMTKRGGSSDRKEDLKHRNGRVPTS